MSVLVTVAGSRASADLELDDACPVRELLPELAAALGEPSLPRGLRTADGGDVGASVSLTDAGVLDGQRLTLVPAEDPSAPPVLACYLALDTSDSMAGPALEALNVEMARFVEGIRADPRLARVCRLAVATFDAEARVDLPLTSASDLRRIPRCAATRPATNYEAPLRLLRHQIATDFEALRLAGCRPLRPAVFFLTDGHPTRGHWPPAHAELTSPRWPDAPDVVAFGFGQAAALVVRRLGTAGFYLPAIAPGKPPRAPAGMLAALMTYLLDRLAAEGLAFPGGWGHSTRLRDDVCRAVAPTAATTRSATASGAKPSVTTVRSARRW
jgi:uncharacterized protein YegL